MTLPGLPWVLGSSQSLVMGGPGSSEGEKPATLRSGWGCRRENGEGPCEGVSDSWVGGAVTCAPEWEAHHIHTPHTYTLHISHHTTHTSYTIRRDARVTQAHNTHTHAHTRTHSGPSQECLKRMQISLNEQEERGEFTAQ